MNIEHLRDETPGCAHRIHLNNAGAGLMPGPVLKAVQDYLTLESEIGGYESEAMQAGAITEAYEAVAALIGAPARCVAFAENTTVAYSLVLSALPFEAGDVILTTRNDYASNQIQFLALQQRLGVDVVRAPDRPEGGVDVDAMARLIRQHRPRLVSVSHIPTNSGLIQDAAAIGAVCQDEGVWYLVDACQSIGQMPVDVADLGCDFLAASARKFLRGPRGAGFLYVSERALEAGLAPLLPDMRGADWVDPDRFRLADDARRFENWESAWALVLGTGVAARYAMALGLEAIQQRVTDLAADLRTRLVALDGVRVLDRGPSLCGIVTVALEAADPPDVVAALRKRRINTSSQRRTSAVLDFDAKGITALLRLSPHYYNTEAELTQAVEALDEVLREQR